MLNLVEVFVKWDIWNVKSKNLKPLNELYSYLVCEDPTLPLFLLGSHDAPEALSGAATLAAWLLSRSAAPGPLQETRLHQHLRHLLPCHCHVSDLFTGLLDEHWAFYIKHQYWNSDLYPLSYVPHSFLCYINFFIAEMPATRDLTCAVDSAVHFLSLA